MQEYVEEKKNRPAANPANISILPVPWMMPGAGQAGMPAGVHYPTVPPVTGYEPSLVPPEQPRPTPDPKQAVYQNVVNAMKEVLDRRSPSQRELPLKPSEIDPKLRHVYTRPPKIPGLNRSSLSRPTMSSFSPAPSTRRRSSDAPTPPIIRPPQPGSIPVR